MTQAIAASTVEFDSDLLERYGVTGPRYTSYPTAPNFRADFRESDYRAYAGESNDEPIPRPLSLYVHIPFCESPCFYCGCTRIITRDGAMASRYLTYLEREIGLQAGLFDRDRPAEQLHFGGGTPNFLDVDEIAALVRALSADFRLEESEERDFSIELDPRYLTPGFLPALAALGFNRASFGVQDFDPDVQQAVNRIQPVSQTRDAVAAAREAGFRSVNLDLIYGLPRQNSDGFAHTLESVIALRPDRIALYAYAHLPERFKAQRQIEARDIPSPAVRLSLLGLAICAFEDAGYRYIGMDHFARPEDALAKAQEAGTLHRTFQGYTTHGGCDLVGLGLSAIGHIGDCYAQNARVLAGYAGPLEAGRLPIDRGIRLSFDDVLRAEVIQSVMCRNRIDIPAIEHRFDIRFAACFAPELEQLRALAAYGLVELHDNAIEVTPRGRLLLRVIAMVFDESLRRVGAQVGGFSRVI